MYLISAYFDSDTTRKLQKLIDKIAKTTGNDFMKRNQVPPHLTLAAFELSDGKKLQDLFEAWAKQQDRIRLDIVSCGMLLPYVFYTMPVLNRDLLQLHLNTCKFIEEEKEASIQRFYQAYHWIPHITLGKTLNEVQMRQSFDIIQKSFSTMQGEIVELGLAKTNPHGDLCKVELSYESQ